MGAREAEAVKRSLAKLAYLVAVIEGCACIVEDMEERQRPQAMAHHGSARFVQVGP